MSASAQAGLGAGLLVGIGLAKLAIAWVGAPQLVAAPAQTLLAPASGESALEPDASTDELLRLVRSPPKASMPAALLLVGSFVLFLLLADRQSSLEHIVVLLAVLLFHEAGHALAMRTFGYRDVRIFFLPGFGAAASGTPNSAPGWREGVVLLLGPVPGIVLGILLLIAAVRTGNETVAYAAQMLLFINAFNLLPVMPLDGGRLFELTVFGRHRVAELALRALSVVALAALAFSYGDYVLGVIAFFQYIGARQGWRIATLATGPQSRQFPFPDRPEAATPELVTALSRHMDPQLTAQPVQLRAAFLRSVIERAIAARNTLRPVAAASLLMAWALAVVIALFAMFLSAYSEGDPDTFAATKDASRSIASRAST
jgi:Zn-dependent protease